MRRETLKDTISISRPVWAGAGFEDAEAQSFWLALPAELQFIALAEHQAGNCVTHILRNDERGAVLIAFQSPPLTAYPSQLNIRVHTRHEFGNYCYDDTLCTYEHVPSGSFVAFLKPHAANAC